MELLVVLLIFGGLGASIWAVVDVFITPAERWAATGQSRNLWAGLIVAGLIFGGLIGVVLAVVYLATIRPKLRAAGSAPPTPAA